MEKLNEFEKEAYEMLQEIMEKPKRLTKKNFKPGKMVHFLYNAKFKKNPYDQSPVIIVLGQSPKYTLGLNWNWCPPKAREKIMDFILKKNKKNIKKNKDIEVSYLMIKKIIKGLGPVIRLYINERISPKGVEIPSYYFYKAINLRAEHFIGISSEDAWKLAVKNYRKK